MWIKNEKGCWINLALAFNVNYGKHYDEYVVYAEFPFYFGKNVADSSFDEKRRLKTFKTAEDAEKFIEDLFNHMNTGAKVGYAFTWLIDKTPAEKPVEKPVDKPADDSELIDGVSL
ncbi:MAG: hypothetical protein IJS29_08920 [Selenomonadaceae bacterium]|nr:hypothetical protein [Selenomonadaceae bacterium]